nr:hypothetical protein [uncultured Draconibacterium sp.]
MKNIRLNAPDKQASKYLVKLGNKRKIEFTNVLKCQRFVGETNKFLTEVLINMNLIYGDVLREYREAWIYFDTQRQGKARKIQVNRMILQLIDDTNSQFEYTYLKSGFSEGSFMVWRNLNLISENIQKIVYALIEMHLSKSNTSKVIQLKLIIENLKTYERKLKRYPEVT